MKRKKLLKKFGISDKKKKSDVFVIYSNHELTFIIPKRKEKAFLDRYDDTYNLSGDYYGDITDYKREEFDTSQNAIAIINQGTRLSYDWGYSSGESE